MHSLSDCVSFSRQGRMMIALTRFWPLHNGTIQTDLYTKPTDKHQHLLSSSCHPQHTKTSIPFSLALRIRRICSTNATFQIRINELKAYLLARGYHNTFLDPQFIRAANISRTDALQTKGWFPYDRGSQIADRNKVCDRLRSYGNYFCDRLRSCDRNRRRSQKIEPCSI